MPLGGPDRQLALTSEGLFRLSPCSIGGTVDAKRPDIENGEQVEPMQLGRKLKPRLFRVAAQVRRRRRTFVGACRLGRDADPA